MSAYDVPSAGDAALTSCARGRHTMPPPKGRQAAARSGRWRRIYDVVHINYVVT